MPENKSVSIGMAGDVMIGRLVNECLDDVEPAYIWGNTLPLLQSTDLNLINLEAALTTSQEAVPKVFNFKADPKKARCLAEGSAHVVNIANNHILDYSESGLLETLETLDNAHIQHVGAGKNIEEASKPVIRVVKGVKIGILGCTDNESDWIATDSHPGTRYLTVGNLKALSKDIEDLRSQVDILILSIHWGPNMKERPSRGFIQFAHHLIDIGVDIIHGHSAHIFQGVELYKSKLILYDTGDFVDDYYVDPVLRNDLSFFFIAEVNKQGILGLRLIPVKISNCQVNVLREKDAAPTLIHMQGLSSEFGTALEIVDGELRLGL